MANVLLGVTGSSSVKLFSKLFNELLKENEVKVIFTESSRKLLGDVDIIWRHKDSFFDKKEFEDYKKDESVIHHINLAQWADKFLIAPCTANTLNKIRYGVCDNLLTSCWMAFDHKNKESFIAPAMNTQMFKNSISTIEVLRKQYKILYPTVKVLSCGDYGLGALADINDIVNIVNGHRWDTPMRIYSPGIRDVFSSVKFNLDIDHPGRFGARRKYDIHSGIDLYEYSNTSRPVTAFEDGKIVHIGPFTGKKAGCDWWEDSDCICIKGKSGIIVYGEVLVNENLKIGQKVITKETIAWIVQILKHPPKTNIPGHSMKMLHVELLSPDAPEPFISGWGLDQERPKYLKDPTIYLFK